MNFELLGHPPDAPTLRLDHERFAYAGKFVLSSTGKAVARDPEEPSTGPDGQTTTGGSGTDGLVGATSFSGDYDDPDRTRIRYVTVREDRRGEGIGPRLLRFTADTLAEQAVAIAVNNPMAYQAAYRAGFVWTGEETGMAELFLSYDPGTGTADRYRAGLDIFAERDLPDPHQAMVDRHADGDPPPVVDVPRRT